MTQWVDFTELKQRVTMVDLLQHYGLLESLKSSKDGEELVGLCPFHEETRGSFHVSTTKNGWNCFGCHRNGNIFDFVGHKENMAIRGAALLIQGWFPENRIDQFFGQSPVGAAPETESVNPPLSFALQHLDVNHPYFAERGLDPVTIEHFGLGYCSRGMMKGRIAIPIHDEKDELVAYAGRWSGDEGRPEGEEKYKLPGGFYKSSVVYNLNRIRQAARIPERLIVTEGFFSCFWLDQCGFPEVVALMGSYLSQQQAQLLVETLGPHGQVTLLFDNDEAGQDGAKQCIQELVDKLYVKQVRLPEGILQPDQLSDEQLTELLS